MKDRKLHNIKDSGFKVPKNYFDALEDSIINQIDLQKKISEHGFKTPDNYFESLEDKILEKSAVKPKVISLFTKRNLIFASSIAAAFVLMFAIFIKNDNISFDDLETATIEDYLFEKDISTYEIVSLFTEENFIDENYLDTELTENGIEEYLLENTTIEDLIIE